MKKTLFAMSLSVAGILSVAAKTWTGAGDDALASNSANWEGGVPVSGDAVVFDAAGRDHPCVWNLEIVPASWVQNGYTNAVTLSVPLAVSGDMVMADGLITVSGPLETDPSVLCVTVKGDLSIGAGAAIDASGKGYCAMYSPAGLIDSIGGQGHGGYGLNADAETIAPYGSVTNPVTAGAGGAGAAGGGIITVTVGGSLAVDGAVRADAAPVNVNSGAGGSVNITAGSITGAGTISADSPVQTSWNGHGGGGRVAVRLTREGSDFSGFTGSITASGAHRAGDTRRTGGAGTVYLRTAAQSDAEASLVVANETAVYGRRTFGSTSLGGAVEGEEFGDVLIGGSAVLSLENSAKLTVRGVLSNGCDFVSAAGSVVAFAGAGESRTFGNFAFANLEAVAPGKTIFFQSGKTVSAAQTVSFAGGADEPLVIRPSSDATAWTLSAKNVSMENVSLSGCTSEYPFTVVNGRDLGGNSANITFATVVPGAGIVWTGERDAAWWCPSNWKPARVPVSTDVVTVPAGCARYPVLERDTAIASLTVSAGASLAVADGVEIEVTGATDLSGSLVLAERSVFRAGGNVSVSGTVSPSDSVFTLSGSTAQTFSASGALFDAFVCENPYVTFSGMFTCASFKAGNGEEAFDLAFAQDCLLVASTFSVSANAGSVNGALRCALPGGTWRLDVNVASVRGVEVSGCDASRGAAVVPDSCRDGGGNVNWLFEDVRIRWTGAASGVFSAGGNWSGGVVPGSGDDIVVTSEGTPPVVSSAASVGSVTVESGATLTVNAALSVAGSFTICDGATVIWDKPGTIAGNLVLLPGATLSHAGHAANAGTESHRLVLDVGGAGYVAEGAAIDLTGLGLQKMKGPGAKTGAASHGGSGGCSDTTGRFLPGECYGSAVCPTNCGSGGASNGYSGGGAAKLSFGGVFTVDGDISADGFTNTGSNPYYLGSGGSVWITAKILNGSGSVHANGGGGWMTAKGLGHSFGGGGRVAVHLTGASDNAAFTGSLAAYGGMLWDSAGEKILSSDSSPGTVYFKGAGDELDGGTLVVAHSPLASFGKQSYTTDIPATNFCAKGELSGATLLPGRFARPRITGDLLLADVKMTLARTGTVADVTCVAPCLYLDGHVLTLEGRRRKIAPDEPMQVDTGDGGMLKWLPRAFYMLFR